MEYIIKITTNVLSSLYQIAGFALIMAILFMFAFMSAREQGWKLLFGRWWMMFKKDSMFRRVFFLAFYVAMILFRTLFNRSLWFRPLEHIIGVWGLYDANGQFTTEVIENLLLFIPFTILFVLVYKDKIISENNRFKCILGKSIGITFIFSLLIEGLQLFLRIGTFQLSDLFYNTLGGLIGGLIYWIGSKLTHRGKKL